MGKAKVGFNKYRDVVELAQNIGLFPLWGPEYIRELVQLAIAGSSTYCYSVDPNSELLQSEIKSLNFVY